MAFGRFFHVSTRYLERHFGRRGFEECVQVTAHDVQGKDNTVEHMEQNPSHVGFLTSGLIQGNLYCTDS